MEIWNDCEIITYGSELVESCKGEVKIEGSEILVSYNDEAGTLTLYKGSEVEHNHFRLKCAEKNGDASLHRFSNDSKILEGSWIEEDSEGTWEGMWKIKGKVK